jgi:UDP-glucose 6-dehydrogenase
LEKNAKKGSFDFTFKERSPQKESGKFLLKQTPEKYKNPTHKTAVFYITNSIKQTHEKQKINLVSKSREISPNFFKINEEILHPKCKQEFHLFYNPSCF